MTSYSGAISEQILVVKVRTNLCQYHYFEDMERLRLRSPVVRALNFDHFRTKPTEQVCRCRCAGAGAQVQVRRCRCAGAGAQV